MGSDAVVDPEARDKYLLQVTAGPSYDPSTHEEVAVNCSKSTSFESEFISCWLKVRIKDYHGLPHGSPSTSPYFEHKLHTSDRYSVAFSFVPKADMSGEDVVLGFDYDHSIKHQLPPGFKYAMKIATSLLDPGLYSDPYSDNPYLYGPALSGIFALCIGERVDEVSADDQIASLENESGGVVEEGAVGSGQSTRKQFNLPSKWKKRRKHFLDPQALKDFTFEKGRMYHADFFNPHLDFANFSLRLPGFSISVARYIDDKTHHLRFVMKNRRTDDPLFVVFFRLLFGKELEQTLKERGDGKGDAAGKTQTQETESRDMEPRASTNGTSENEHQQSSEAERSAQQSQPKAAKAESDDDKSDVDVAPTAVTSLAGSITSALSAMGLWNDTSSSSSSDSETTSRNHSTQASTRSLEAQVDDMDDSTVESFLQSRQGNTHA